MTMTMTRVGRGFCRFAWGVVLATLVATAARAEGALVVGVPSAGLRQGFAYGYAYNKATAADAIEEATSICREQAKKNELDPAICTDVRPFAKGCVAVAMDPVNRWAGWSIAATQRAAEQGAIAACRKGGKACKLADAGCES